MKTYATLIAAVAALSLSCACASAKQPSAGRTATIVSYQVNTLSKFMEDSAPVVAEILKVSGADLIGLNSLDSCNARHNIFQLKEVADLFGTDQYYFAPAFPYKGGSFGEGILSRRKILKSETLTLPALGGNGFRAVGIIETEDCIFAVTQLAAEKTGAQQAEIINDWFTAHYAGSKKPVFLCGHMAGLPDSETIGTFIKKWRILNNTAIPNYPSKAPDRCYSYIMVLKKSAPVKVLHATVLRSNASKSNFAKAAGHLPVCVTVSF